LGKKLIELREITRIEGHLNLDIILMDGEVAIRAAAREGTRILEKALIGREYWEVPEIVSRMCGVCSVIHKVTAVMAVEKAMNIEPPIKARLIRELIVIGGHIQSHLLHLFYFVLPDLLGVNSIIDNIMRNIDTIKTVMRVKKWANSIVERLGGRAIHPITPLPGGLSKDLMRESLVRILDESREIKKLAIGLVRKLLEIEWPNELKEKNFVSLKESGEIPLLTGYIKVGGKIVSPENYLKEIVYIPEKYSTAPHFLLRSGESFMVGALARLNNNAQYLNGVAKELCKEYGIKYPMYSPFANNVSQALEIIYFIEKAEEIIKELIEMKTSEYCVEVVKRKGEGVAITEAPRGLLVHSYKINDEGKVLSANIITPTAQNLKNIEENAKKLVKKMLDEGSEINEIRKRVEALVRSYDPCISCAARFQKAR